MREGVSGVGGGDQEGLGVEAQGGGLVSLGWEEGPLKTTCGSYCSLRGLMKGVTHSTSCLLALRSSSFLGWAKAAMLTG